MQFKNYFLFFCLLVLTGVFLPENILSQTSGLYFKHLTPDDGLTQSVINDIYTDTKGFVWMTGLDGVNRFDGSHCLANDEIAPGLTNPGKTKKILEDNNGDIWFGYNEGIIRYSYHNNRFTTYKIPPQQLSRYNVKKSELYYPIAGDKNDYLLVGGIDKAVVLFNTITAQFQYYDQTENNNNSFAYYFPPGIPSLQQGWKQVEYNEDSIFVCTLTGLQSGKTHWSRLGFSSKAAVLSSGLITADNTIFFYSNGRICKYCLSSGELRFSPEVKINDIYISFTLDAKGNLWVSGINNGLQVLDTASMQLLSYFSYNNQNSNGISGNSVTAFIDRNQILWLTVWGRGVDYANLNEERFTSFLTTGDTWAYDYSNFIRGIVESPMGGFYCSTQSGIIELDENLQFKKKFPGSPPGLQYPDICICRDKLYYVSDALQAPGLYQYDLQKGYAKKTAFAGSSRPYQLCKTRDNNLLVATMNGLWKFDVEKQKTEAYPVNTSATDVNEVVVYSFEDKQQQLYKCLNNLGFSVYRRAGDSYKEVFWFNEKITIKHITAQNDSLLWMGTSGGLYLFNSLELKMVKHYTTRQGLADNVVYAVMQDEKNNLWLSTNKGLSYFEVSGNRFINFTKEDGLQANEFNTHAVIKSKNGRIIFGGVNGLTVVNPRILTAKMPPPVLQITALKSDSICNPFPYNEKGSVFILNAGTNSFEIKFTAISFRNPALSKIKYRLKNHDNDWLMTSNPGIVHYSKLPPGKYILEAMASNARGEFGGDVKQLVILVKTYWWKTSWFKIIAIAFLILLSGLSIMAYLRFRLKRQKEKAEKQLAVQTERERIIADLHDDVGATLSSINIYGELANTVWDEQPEQSKEMVSKISGQSKELMAKMSDIVWSLKSPLEEKNSFLLKMKNYCQDLLAGKGIAAGFNIDEKLDITMTNPLARKNLLLIAKEAINNIAKYSKATEAFITLNQQESNAQLIIRDNGKGFDKTLIVPGNGLGNIEQRCRQLNGTCIIESAPGKGVNISCRFPIAIISHTG